jgi:excisionase family DNA binding protein
MSSGEYAEGTEEQAEAEPLLELEAATTPSARPVEALESVEGLTITEAASAFGLSVSSIRRLLKAGKLLGAAKVSGPKGSEYRIPPGALEALGYKARATAGGAALTVARAALETEVLSGRVAELEASLELERVRRLAAEEKAQALEANLDDLRLALSKLPAALERPKRRGILRR